ncbi:MAG: hypothetical protein Q9190_007142, partial [Brigantiaea leucoxantha]
MLWIFSLLLGIFLFFQSVTQAVPLEDNPVFKPKLSSRAGYPNDYPYPEKDDCTNLVKTETDKSLFYTGLGGFGLTAKQLQGYKRQKSLHIVGDSFTYRSGFVDPKNQPSDPVTADQYYKRFADEFSEAMAEQSSGEVFLLLDWATDANNPPASACQTTWYRKEYPALKSNSAVTKVTQVNPQDFSQTKQIWPSGGPKLVRRGDDECLDWDPGHAPNLQGPPTGEEDTSSSPPPPAYAPGTCSFHLDEWEDCADDSSNLFAKITLYDNNKAIIGQTQIDPAQNPLGDPINNSNPLLFNSKLPNALKVTGEHEHDYIQFDYGDLHFQSRNPNGGGQCTVGGWDPRDGPDCTSRFGLQNA